MCMFRLYVQFFIDRNNTFENSSWQFFLLEKIKNHFVEFDLEICSDIILDTSVHGILARKHMD